MITALLLSLAMPLDGAEIARWLEGRFDNGAQVQAEGDPERPHLYVIHQRFTSDAVPGTLVYAQLQAGEPGGTVYRQRVYAFEDPGEDGRLRMGVYAFIDPRALTVSEGRTERLAALTADDLVRSDPECDFYWQADGEGYAGEIEDGACLVTSARTNQHLIITARFTIDADAFTHVEAGRFADGREVAFDAPGGVPNIYDRLD